MSETASATQQERLESLRRHRAELRESMSSLEHALAAPATGDHARWLERVTAALTELSSDFHDHVDITEGPDGLYAELLSTAPRLAGTVHRLTLEHGRIRGQVDLLATSAGAADPSADVDGLRELGTSLLGTLMRHRQRGSDLVYEAYEADVGGET